MTLTPPQRLFRRLQGVTQWKSDTPPTWNRYINSSKRIFLGYQLILKLLRISLLIQLLAEPLNQERASWWRFSDRVGILGFRPCLMALHPEEVHYTTFVIQELLFYIEQAFLFRQFFWLCIFILFDKNFNKYILSIYF